jgi:hypothetical protein
VPKEVAVPAQDGLWLDDEQRVTPGGQPTGEQDEDGAVGAGAAGALHAASEDEELLAEEGVLEQEVRLAAPQVGHGADEEGSGRGLGEGAQTSLEDVDEGTRSGGQVVEQVDQHDKALLEEQDRRQGAWAGGAVFSF